MIAKIDCIITSRLRWDLLIRTINSLKESKSYDSIKRILVYEDSDCGVDKLKQLKKDINCNKVTLFGGAGRVGQVRAIDSLISKVDSEFFLQIEDDWEIHSTEDFIEPSINFMALDHACICVWLRGTESKDLNHHPVKNITDKEHVMLDPNYIWKGFAFAPTIKRLSEYKITGPYQKITSFNPKKPWESEYKLGLYYKNLNMYAVTSKVKYFNHIGDNRGIRS